MNNKKILLSTFNFEKNAGIQDYLNFFKKNFKDKIIIKKKLSNDYDKIILIDDFSSLKNVNILNNFKKKNPNIIIILIYTEFINKKLKTFNNFDIDKTYHNFLKQVMISYEKNYNNFYFKIPLKIIFILKIIFFKFKLVREKNEKTHEYKLSFSVFIKDINYLNYVYRSKIFSLFISILSNLLKSKHKYLVLRNIMNNYFDKSLKQKLVNVSYFSKRFENIKKIKNNIDIILCSHPQIAKQLHNSFKNLSKKNKIFTLKFYPSKKISNNKNIKKIVFTGEFTKFRKYFFESLCIKSETLLQFTKNLNLSIFKSVHEDKNKFLYTLNPVKERYWIFSSPTRYIRSIYRNEIPIVFNDFNDYTDEFTFFIDQKQFNPIDLIHNYKHHQNTFNKKLNSIVQKHNDHIKNLNFIFNV